MSGMIDGLPLMKADDGTGVSGACPERQLSVPTRPHGAPFHDIGEVVVAKRSPLVSQTILRHAQPRREISLGESQLNTLWELSDRWSLRIGGNIGGFGVDNVDQTYEFVGALGYHFKLWDQSANVFAGWRQVYIDFGDSSVDLDLTVKGPIFGFGLDF